jgi:hypothetical protein
MSQDELESFIGKEVIEEEEQEYAADFEEEAPVCSKSEALRMQQMQQDFINKSKKVQIAEHIFKYEV